MFTESYNTMKATLSVILAILALPMIVFAAPVLVPSQGGTGTSSTPTADQILIGVGSGAYGLK